jgi:hypothetical protein
VKTAVEIFAGSNGDETKELYARLNDLGPTGLVALNLFRAQKCSDRAKVYRGGIRGRGSFRSMAYDRKNWSLRNLCDVLSRHAKDLGISWGWGEDTGTEGYAFVLYVELPAGQVSFHAPERGTGPSYGKPWDGLGISRDRILAYAQAILDGKPPPGPACDRLARTEQGIAGGPATQMLL